MTATEARTRAKSSRSAPPGAAAHGASRTCGAPQERISVDQALTDLQLLGAVLGDLETWQTWRTVLKATFGIALNREEVRAFASVAGSRKPPAAKVQQLWAIVGRRGGKSRIAAAVLVYLATCVDYSGCLVPGETGYVLCVAPTQKQAQSVLGYVRAFLEASPILRQEIVNVTADEIKIRANITIAVHPANYRTLRGRTLLAVVLDETALFRDEMSAQPDVEILRACVPALLTTKGMVIGISTPYGQRGLVFEKYRDHFGQDDDTVLVVKGSSTQFNPTLDLEQIKREIASDPLANRAEYEAEFRADMCAYVDRATVERCVEVDRRERPFLKQYRYHAFGDPSGGQHDSFAIGISHREGERVVLDTTREWRAPFDPASVVTEAVALLREYRCNTITGDRYASGWVEGEFAEHGIRYEAADRDKSRIFIDALPLLTSGNAVLLDDLRLVGQICQLQRETGRSGRDIVRKMRGAHDDLANAALGSLVYAQAGAKRPRKARTVVVQGVENYNPFTGAIR
jgi:hypothetical protein